MRNILLLEFWLRHCEAGIGDSPGPFRSAKSQVQLDFVYPISHYA
jgi:hypothetical protein